MGSKGMRYLFVGDGLRKFNTSTPIPAHSLTAVTSFDIYGRAGSLFYSQKELANEFSCHVHQVQVSTAALQAGRRPRQMTSPTRPCGLAGACAAVEPLHDFFA